ncbi:MAG TPA: TetR/AcrR family transcriptional regulator [Candidatus Melainabacteria bacterium]|jgi:AcrR family transcriptional regulator|nr:TetR/AcrR family transcriptional regulator [Candidatus Melainabacteria bacterium]HIN65896.1 TetR/AcrR family transcriptional regulator [Candidatus Obscuribacterales bacterium]
MVRPRAENYLERQQGILDAAAAMFAKHGFNGTSIAALADSCGVSKALLYHYYDSKEALLYDMLLVHCKLLSETASNATKESDKPEEQLRSLVRALMELYMSSRDKHVVLLNDLHCLPENQQTEIKEEERKVLQEIKDLITKLRPDLKPPQVTSLTMYLMGAVNWTYTWFKPQGQVTASEFADLATATFLNGVLTR